MTKRIDPMDLFDVPDDVRRSQIAWERARLVLRMREQHGMQFAEIGRLPQFKVCRERVRQLYMKAKRVQAHPERGKSSPFESWLTRSLTTEHLKNEVLDRKVEIRRKGLHPRPIVFKPLVDQPKRERRPKRAKFAWPAEKRRLKSKFQWRDELMEAIRTQVMVRLEIETKLMSLDEYRAVVERVRVYLYGPQT